jgi:hypothetical protein
MGWRLHMDLALELDGVNFVWMAYRWGEQMEQVAE